MRTAWTTTIFAISLMQIGIYPAKCENPEVSRRRMLIYRIAEEIEVEVVQCKYYDHKHPALTYFDITKNCLISPKTGIFVDKWEERTALNPVSLVDMKQYKAKADPIRNEIKLRSGTICRYDRGFCYDAMEKESYAAVWEVKRKDQVPVESCPTGLEQLFYGPVDIWDFPQKRMKYLVFSDNHDKAFYLRLVKKIDCRNIETWVTEDDIFLVSSLRLTPQLKDTSILNQHYFPLKSLKVVSEAIMKNVELQEYPLDFNNQMSTVYFEEPDNARILFYKLREELLLEIKSASENITGGSSYPETYLSEINNLKQSIIEKTNEIKIVLKKLEHTDDDLRVTKNDLSKFQALINSFSKTYNKDVVDFNITMSEMNRNINSESDRISKLIATKNLEFVQKFEQLNSLIKKQVINLATKPELAGKLSELKVEINKLLKEHASQLKTLLEKNVEFEHSLNALRNYKNDLKKDFEAVKGKCDLKLGVLEQKVDKNFDLFKKELQKVLDQTSKNKGSSASVSEISELRKNIEDFKVSLRGTSDIGFNDIRGRIKTISQKSVTKEDLLNLQAQLDVMNSNISGVKWNILKNIKNDPISSLFVNNELSALREKVNKNMEELKQELSSKLAQYGSRCNCIEEINKLSENFKNSLLATQQYILQKTNSLVETTQKEILTELNGETLILKGQIDINKVQLVEILTHRLQEKDNQIAELERTLRAEIKNVQQKTDAVSKKITNIEKQSGIAPESE